MLPFGLNGILCNRLPCESGSDAPDRLCMRDRQAVRNDLLPPQSEAEQVTYAKGQHDICHN